MRAAGRTWQLATDECEHSVHAEHWPLDQAHLVPQSLAFFGHQDSQSGGVAGGGDGDGDGARGGSEPADECEHSVHSKHGVQVHLVPQSMGCAAHFQLHCHSPEHSLHAEQ